MTHLPNIQISRSALKIIALLAMLIDHIGLFLIQGTPYKNAFQIDLLDLSIPWYVPFRAIGRIAFPLFCFMVVEGYLHTHDRRKYGRNLLIFALISELPWNIAFTGTFFYGTQNVMFTLLLGYFGIVAFDRYRCNAIRLTMSLLTLFALSVLLRADYGYFGFVLILLIYVLHQDRLHQSLLLGLLYTAKTKFGGLTFLITWFYNGRKGCLKGNFSKYLFYIFYPAHLLILYFIRRMLM